MNILDANLRFNGRLTPLNKSAVKGFIFHHMAHETWGLAQVHNYHRDGNGWAGIGYNYFIDREGHTWKGRGDNVGAHTAGYNSTYLGIGFQGDFERGSQVPTDAQYAAAAELVPHLQNSGYSNAKELAGHGKYGNTSCPGRRFDIGKITAAPAQPTEGPTNTKPAPAKPAQPSPQTFAQLSNSAKFADATQAVRGSNLTVAQYQRLLLAVGESLPRFGADNDFGGETLAATQSFQRKQGISSASGDNYGRPGPATLRRLRQLVRRPSGNLSATPSFSRGATVRQVQRVVGATVDGVYGPNTVNAVRTYQRTNGLAVDGVVGPLTWRSMFGA